MKKATIIWLIIAASLMLVGGILFGGGMTMLSWDFTKLSTVEYETREYEIADSYRDISIVTDTAQVELKPSENGATSVVCREQKNVTHSVEVQGGSLVIKVHDHRKWYEHIGVSFHNPKVTVYVPQGEYGALCVKATTGNVEIPDDFSFDSVEIGVTTGAVQCQASALGKHSITTTTGDIRVENLSAKTLSLSVTTGAITARSITCQGDVQIEVDTGFAKLTDISCENLTSTGDTGYLSMKNVVAKGTFSIERSTGNVTFAHCDAAEIFVNTDTGNVTGTLLTDKIFIAKSDTGRVRVPSTTTGGKCQIHTDTGDIKIEIQS